MRILSLFILLCSLQADASAELENEKLVEVSLALDHVISLLKEAKAYQNKQSAIQFRYEQAVADVDKIQQGINEKFHPLLIEPRAVEPIDGDYVAYSGDKS